jgi:Phage capsid family
MTDLEKKALADQIGKEASDKVSGLATKVDKLALDLAKKADSDTTKGFISAEDFNAYKDATTALAEETKSAALKQGADITALKLIGVGQEVGKKMGVGEFLHSKQNELKAIKGKQQTHLDFMITADKDGNFHANEIQRKEDGSIITKATGIHATIDAVPGAGTSGVGNVASIFQSMSAASILRSVADAPMNEQYRNNTWLFGVLGLEQVGMENRTAFYFDEEPKQGGSAIVAEGAAKPYVQYGARLRSADYRKRAVALEFTDEFMFDFQFLQSYFLSKARIDLFNDINQDIYSRLQAGGVAYSAGDATNFKLANGGVVANGNSYDVLTALAAKVNKNTFGANANAAIMSTEKAAAISITKDTQGRYVGRPDYIGNMNFIENPSVGIDDVMVGDFSQYILQLRGGLIVRAGLNGNNLIENKMTYVMEQFYFDYISPLRAAAILKGTTFAAVKTLITT